MRLSVLLQGVEVTARSGPLPEAIAGLHYDSRQIRTGWVFFAVRGERFDGNQFVPAVLAQGACMIVSEAQAPAAPATPWVQVRDIRAALAQASANWFGRPADRLRLVGITGTNGKTTTAYLVEAVLAAAGWRPGLLGTIENHVGGAVEAAPHTTPESYDLQALLARMVAAGCGTAVMEVSSHALAMERVWGCRYEVGVFTNLTQDHLDFHGTMERYREAKRLLFTGVGAAPPQAAVIHQDDPAAAAMVKGFQGPVWRYGFGAGSDLRARDVLNGPDGLRFRIERGAQAPIPVHSPLLGRVNALNLMAAIGVGAAMGLDPEEAARAASRLERVPGRFERVNAGQPFPVVVDYAHTPDALANVLALAREVATGRVLVVFGCGGDRDRGKRPLMGRVAAQAADWMLVTSDNPRHEAPEAIIAEVLAGAHGGAEVGSEPDRAAAIGRAMREARAGDIVVVAGKGHETCQIVGDTRLPFADAEVARQAWLETIRK